MNAALPSFFRPPSTERDQTIMRPPNDDFCLQVPNSSDYLIPLDTAGPRTAAERLLSEATCVTLSESVTTCSAPTISSPSVPKLMNDSGCWETSFIMPNSKSDQLLLSPDNTSSDDKLISLDTPQQTPTTTKPPHSFNDKDTGPPITLDPASLPKQGMSYANVRMNSGQKQNDDKITANGSVTVEKAQPFTIQGFNDRYISNENHSEISC